MPPLLPLSLLPGWLPTGTTLNPCLIPMTNQTRTTRRGHRAPISWGTSPSLSRPSAMLRKRTLQHGINRGKPPALFFVNVSCFVLMGLTRRGHCLAAAILLTPWHLTGSAFRNPSRVSLDSKQPLIAFYSTEKMRLLLEESAALPVCLAARHHTACLKLASPINHLHNEVPASAL